MHGGPTLSPQGSPCCVWVLGCPALPPLLYLALCILCLLPALPTWPWDPWDPQDPRLAPLALGTLSGHGGAVLSPSLLPALRGVAAGLGQLVALQSPPRLPLSVGVLWGSPWLHSHSPLELLGEFRGDPRTVATSCSPPGPPSRGSVPLPFTLPGSPALGGPHPVGFPVPRGSPALGGRRARAGPSNADFVSLSPV